jgi:hypothetical protein
MHLESYTKIDEHAKISGVALIPRISRNQNLYTKEELKRFDNKTVPLNWEHDPDKVIGKATFHYNADTETVFYEGEITDPSASILAKNRLLYTSIEATPTSVKHVCNGSTDCFSMPYGLIPEGLALTETPGVPETSVSIIENYISECNHEGHDHIHKTITRDGKETKLDFDHALEKKKEVLGIFRKISDDHPEPMIYDQIELLESIINNDTEKLTKIVDDMKERYLCKCCNELKKNN